MLRVYFDKLLVFINIIIWSSRRTFYKYLEMMLLRKKNFYYYITDFDCYFKDLKKTWESDSRILNTWLRSKRTIKSTNLKYFKIVNELKFFLNSKSNYQSQSTPQKKISFSNWNIYGQQKVTLESSCLQENHKFHKKSRIAFMSIEHIKFAEAG